MLDFLKKRLIVVAALSACLLGTNAHASSINIFDNWQNDAFQYWLDKPSKYEAPKSNDLKSLLGFDLSDLGKSSLSLGGFDLKDLIDSILRGGWGDLSWIWDLIKDWGKGGTETKVPEPTTLTLFGLGLLGLGFATRRRASR